MRQKPKKPPLPHGKEPAPRRRKTQGSPLANAIDHCTKLINSDSTFEDITEYIKQTSPASAENDRTAAIILASNLENALDELLISRLDSERCKRLFKVNAPLGNFSNKIDLAYALKLFGSETKSNLDIVRNVRNVFAHCKRPVTFNTPEISNICELLVIPKVLNALASVKTDFETIAPNSKHKAIYRAMCLNTQYHLIRVSRPDKFETLP